MADNSDRESFFDKVKATASSMYNAVMRGGEVQAAFRQGFNELGTALKAFPDSIQVDEPDAVFNPIYSDIAADKRRFESPGEIDMGGKTTGSVQGQVQQDSKQHLPSPAAIEAAPLQQAGQHQGNVHGRADSPYGPEHGVYGPEHGVYGHDNGAQGPQAAIDAAKAESNASPNQIAEGMGPPGKKSWQEFVMERRKPTNQDGDAGNDQNEQASGRSPADEQKEQDRGGRGR